jgi:hypothetical protein
MQKISSPQNNVIGFHETNNFMLLSNPLKRSQKYALKIQTEKYI